MIEHPRWRDAEAAANRLTESDRRALLLLVRLPLIWEAAIERLYGLSGGASVYRCLARLRTMGLITEMRPALRPVRNPGLFHLTDLGIATVAVDRQVDPEYLARRTRLRGTDLLARLACLPHVLAVYDLLAALADSRTGRIDLLAWEQPWRRTFTRPTRRAPVSVELPAHAVLSWGSQAASCLLVPDLANFPFHVHRHLLAQLLAMRHLTVDAFPTLVVATTDARQAAWHHLLRDVARERGEALLSGVVATWSELREDRANFDQIAPCIRPTSSFSVRHLQLPPLDPRPPGKPIPQPVRRGLSLGAVTAHQMLTLTGMERDLLDLIGRHPFLSPDSLAAVLGWEVRRLRERLARVIRNGLVRLLEVGVRRTSGLWGLAELTVQGLELVAAQQGLSLPQAVRYNGLAGGGPEHEVGARHHLLRNLEHTVGADAVFVDLYRRLGTSGAATGGDAVLEWRNAAACSRRRMRPDGYGMIRRGGELFGFFLELDRGTMGYRDYGEKWAAYYHYGDSGDFERDYDGFPTILVVTTENAVEERIARSVRAAGVGRWAPLPVLLTCEWRINRDPTNSGGLLGPIWREPHASFAERCRWPPAGAPRHPRAPKAVSGHRS